MNRWQTSSGYQIIQVLSGRSNVFLLTNGEKNVLIDTSVSRLWNRLPQKLEKMGISNIDYLILTHAHFDHAANANQIKKNFNASVIIHKEEALYLSSGENILPDGTTVITRLIVNVFGKRLLPGFRYEPCKYDLLVDSHFHMKDFGFNAYLMHTPGHTIGSMSLIIDDELAIVGDCMFGVFKWSVFPPYSNDIIRMINSWDKLLNTGCRIFLPGHGKAISRKLLQKEYERYSRKHYTHYAI